MQPRDKDEAMVSFRNHEYDILVATAVIEVGIDVPNATTMLIEGAIASAWPSCTSFAVEVGRGIHQSYCVLVSDRDNEVTKQRLEAMEATRDGFKLAEIDLQLRGPGESSGTRQSGTLTSRRPSLADTRLLHAANLEAQKILAEDPKLETADHALLKAKVDAFWADAANRANSSGSCPHLYPASILAKGEAFWLRAKRPHPNARISFSSCPHAV